METIKYNSLDLYTWNFKYYYSFTSNDCLLEGEIIIAYGDHGGERYPYISHVEQSSDDQMTDEQQELFEQYLEENINKVLEAKAI